MGFWNKLYETLFGYNYNKVDRTLSHRIIELKTEEKRLQKILKENELKEIDIPWFHLEISDNPHVGTLFVVPTQKDISSMEDLLNERIQKEQERIENLKKKIRECFDTVRIILDNENVEQAENLLYQISPSLEALNIEELSVKYNKFFEEIPIIKERIKQRELKIQEDERLRKIEEQRLKAEEELSKEKALIEAQKERERKAHEYDERLAQEAEAILLEIERLTAIVSQKKDDYQEFLQWLRLKDVSYFYHFTDKDNIPYIKKYGGSLVSR